MGEPLNHIHQDTKSARLIAVCKRTLKVKVPGELTRMASIWRIDGVFWTCALKKRGQVFTRVGLVDLYSVLKTTRQFVTMYNNPRTVQIEIKEKLNLYHKQNDKH